MSAAESKRKHYLANREHYIQQARDKRAERRAYVVAAKTDKPCTDCKVIYPSYVVDFDHLGEDKDRDIAKMITHSSLAKIILEIAKCELVCSNCHRIRTHTRKTTNAKKPRGWGEKEQHAADNYVRFPTALNKFKHKYHWFMNHKVQWRVTRKRDALLKYAPIVAYLTLIITAVNLILNLK